MTEFITAHSYLIAQICGFTAMGLAILTYQFNKQKTVNLLLMAVEAIARMTDNTAFRAVVEKALQERSGS